MADQLPASNNVYGVVNVAESELGSVMMALTRAHRWDHAVIQRSSYSGEQRLRMRSATAEFETEQAPDGSGYLLKGCVAGDLDSICLFVKAMSEALVEMQISHRLEVIDESDVVRLRIRENGTGED